MDCEQVRDRFSSLWEREVSPFEEKILEEHLSSCPECQEEFERFERTMRWLHSVGEMEVPEGFLSEVYKKREEKKGAVPAEKSGGRWFHFPLSFKLPAQAVAMVAIVFLVLYLTKMMPMEGGRLKETKQPSSPLSVQEKPERVSTPSATPPRPEIGSMASPISKGEVEKRGSATTLNEPSPSVRQAHRPEQSRGTGPPIPPPKSEIMAYQQMEPEGAGGEKTPSPVPGKMRRELDVQEKPLVVSKPPQEILLKISDRKKVIVRLHELVKQFGGEVVGIEGDRFLASLPSSSFLEFEKELAGLRSSAKADRLIAEKDAAGSLGIEEGAKREERDVKSKGSARLAADTERRTIVRILLVEE